MLNSSLLKTLKLNKQFTTISKFNFTDNYKEKEKAAEKDYVYKQESKYYLLINSYL